MVRVMGALKARVRNGRLLLDEPTDLPEGKEVELLLADEVLSDEDTFDDEERAALDAELEAGYRRGSGRECRRILVDVPSRAVKVELTSRAAREAARRGRWWRKNRPAAADLFERELRNVPEEIGTNPARAKLYTAESGQKYFRLLMSRMRCYVYFVVNGPTSRGSWLSGAQCDRILTFER